MTGPRQVALLRLAAQRLVGAPAASPQEAVRWLAAVQGQDARGALLSVALRTASGTLAGVEAALDAGLLVRSWPLRGTLHLTCADDLPWLLALLAPGEETTSRRRQRQLGLDQAQLERAGELAAAALEGGRRLRREELFAVWDAAGVATAGQRGVHLLRHLALAGTVVLGPTAGGRQLVVLARDWLPPARPREREQALGELALRYLRSHGPATVADLARWAGLGLREARAGTALARPRLEALDVEGTEHLMDPATPQRLADARADADGVLLLPGFDEFVLGYADRSAQLDPASAERVVPGGNGMFRPTVVSAGAVVGTWRSGGAARPALPDVEPFAPLAPRVAAAVAARYARLP